MPTRFTSLDSARQRLHGWARQPDLLFTRVHPWVPVFLAELAHAMAIFPLGFAPRGSGGHHLVALLGLHPGENLFVDGAGRWLREYIPGWYRAYPFRILQSKQGEKTVNMVGFDLESGLYREQPDAAKGEQRFFDDEGKLQPHMRELVSFLEAMSAGERLTQKAVDALDAAQLLEPWALPVENPDPKRALLTGLKRVSLPALNKLDAPALQRLRDTGALAIAYAQILCTPRFGFLRNLCAVKHAQPAASPPPPAAAAAAPAISAPLPSSLDALFGEDSGGTLKFGP